MPGWSMPDHGQGIGRGTVRASLGRLVHRKPTAENFGHAEAGKGIRSSPGGDRPRRAGEVRSGCDWAGHGPNVTDRNGMYSRKYTGLSVKYLIPRIEIISNKRN